MLVLSRKIGERIIINDNITVEVLQVIGNRVRLGVTAPAGIPILREELVGAAPKGAAKDDTMLEAAGAVTVWGAPESLSGSNALNDEGRAF